MRRAVPIALLSLAAVGCHSRAPYAEPPTVVTVRPIERYAAAAGVRYSASIEPRVRIELAFKSGGFVDSVFQVRDADGRMRDVQEGDRVGRGTALATLRDSDYVEKRAQAGSQLREAEVSLAQATEDYERAKRLLDRKSLTRTDYDAAKLRMDVTRTKVDGAQAVVRDVERSMGDTALRAPLDALVLARRVEVGALATPGAPAFSLADTREVKVVFGAPDVMVRAMKLGAPLTVTTASLPGDTFTGRITLIAPLADPRTRVFDVEVTIPNADDRLKIGMVASLQVDEHAAGTAPLVVGLGSIVRDTSRPDGYAVFVLDTSGGKSVVRRRPVALGQAVGNWIAVTSGLSQGERVVTNGATLVTDGAAVTVAGQ